MHVLVIPNLRHLMQNTYSQCIAGKRTWLYGLPQSKIIMYSFLFGVLLSCKKFKKILAVRQVWEWWPLASVMLTVRFPITWFGNVWEPAPPPAVWAWVAYLIPSFWISPSDTITLSHWLVIGTLGSHSSTTSSPSTPPPSATASLEPRVSIFPFFSTVVLFFCGLPFSPSSASI